MNFFLVKRRFLFIKINPPYTFTIHFTISLKMSDETHSKKSQNQNPTKSQNSTESPEFYQISRTGDILKGPFLQKRIKKNINKRFYVLKIKKNLHFHPIYLQGCSEKPVPTKKNKEER
jgi:hypothetical protein